MSSGPAATPSIIYLGMDVHKDSITIAVLPMGTKAPTHLDRLPNELPKLKRYLERLARQGELRSCYEASGAGYVLHRALREWGYACEVIAPSLIPKRPGVLRKHDNAMRRNSRGSLVPASSRQCGFPPKQRNACATSCAVGTPSSARSSSRDTTS